MLIKKRDLVINGFVVFQSISCLFSIVNLTVLSLNSKVVVPMPSWEASTNKPLAKSKRELDKVSIDTFETIK